MSAQLALPLDARACPCARWIRGDLAQRARGVVFRASDYGVEPLDWTPAARFVSTHHYLGTSLPAGRVQAGLYRRRPGPAVIGPPELVGVLIFSQPGNEAVVPHWLGLPADQGVELGRLVLLEDVPKNGEGFLVRRGLGLLRAALPGVRGVVSKAATGRGHYGACYNGVGANFLGASRGRWGWRFPDGTDFNERAVSKVRALVRGEPTTGKAKGAWGAIRRLVARGAADPGGVPAADWLPAALAAAGATRVWSPPKYSFGFALGGKDQRRAVRKRFRVGVYDPPAYQLRAAG